MSLIYKHEARGRETPKGGVLINQPHPEKEVLKVIYLWNKRKCGRMLIDYLLNKESIR